MMKTTKSVSTFRLCEQQPINNYHRLQPQTLRVTLMTLMTDLRQSQYLRCNTQLQCITARNAAKSNQPFISSALELPVALICWASTQNELFVKRRQTTFDLGTKTIKSSDMAFTDVMHYDVTTKEALDGQH